jgi:hypothetical protein
MMMCTEKKLKYRQKRRIRQYTTAIGCCLAVLCYLFYLHSRSTDGLFALSWPPSPAKALSNDLLNNLTLTEGQCQAAFPGLMREIHDAVFEGPFTVKPTGDAGPLQGRIKDRNVRDFMVYSVKSILIRLMRQLYIIHAARKRDLSKEMLNVSPQGHGRHVRQHSILTPLSTIRSPEPRPLTNFTAHY